MTIEQINARLAQIREELNNTDADFVALEKEIDALLKEKTVQEEAEESRSALIKRISTMQGVNTMKKPVTTDTLESSSEYRNAWLASLMGKTLTTEQRALVSASGAIPTETLNKIVSRFDESPLLSKITMLHIPGNVSIPVESAVSDVSWVGMGTASTDGTSSVTTVTLAAYKLIKTLEIGADLQAMAIPAFEAWLVGRLSNKIMSALSAAVINGTGSGQPTGLEATITTATGTYTKQQATYADLVEIVGSLGTAYVREACFIMQRTLFYTDVVGIVDADGQPVVHRDPANAALLTILGYPVILDDNCTADDIWFGDPTAYYLNIASEVAVTSDDSVGFRTGSRVYRGMCLADGKLAEADAFVLYQRSAT